MLVQIPGPKILSEACHEFSARLDVKAFDPERTPRELGVKLPENLRRSAIVRQAEFVAGRFAALHALKAAGCSSIEEITVNGDRSPRWPEGFVGSITHTSGICIGGSGESYACRRTWTGHRAPFGRTYRSRDRTNRVELRRTRASG